MILTLRSKRVVLVDVPLYRNFSSKSVALQKAMFFLIFVDPQDRNEGTSAKAALSEKASCL